MNIVIIAFGYTMSLPARLHFRIYPNGLETALVTNSPLWQDNSFQPLGSLRESLQADLCVVGLGAAGLTAVLEGLQRGWRVVGLDARQPGSGAAGRNGGFLLAGLADFHHDACRKLGRQRAADIYRATVDELDRAITESPEVIRRTGSLRLAVSPEEELDCRAELVQLLADGLAAAEHYSPQGFGLLIPTDAVCNPWQRCQNLVYRALGAGAQLFGNTPALLAEPGKVITPEGSISCDQIIIASDGGLHHLVPEVAHLLRPVRLQMLATAPAPEVTFPRPTYARFGMDYWQQLPDGRIALGGCRDIGGDEEYTENSDPSRRIQTALEELLRHKLRVTAPITHRWAAVVTYNDSGLPIAVQAQRGIWALGGYNGTGNLLGPLAARAVTSVISGEPDRRAELLGIRG